MALEHEARETLRDTEKGYQPIQSPNSAPHGFESTTTHRRETAGSPTIVRSHSRSINPIRSYSDGHGHACVSNVEEPLPTDGGTEDCSEKQFEVQWDGDSDPSNPRSRSRFRKWLIVLIVSASSLCVYVRST